MPRDFLFLYFKFKKSLTKIFHLCILIIPIFSIFSSFIIHRKHDGGRLDNVKVSYGERRDDKTSTNRTVTRNFRICYNDAGVCHANYSSLLWYTNQASNESYGSKQTVTAADVLFLRHRSEPAI